MLSPVKIHHFNVLLSHPSETFRQFTAIEKYIVHSALCGF